MTYIFSIIGLMVLLSASVHADTWSRGALALHAVSGEVVLSELGKDPIGFSNEEVPQTMSGLVSCRAVYGSSAFFSASNQSFIFFEGDGSFAVERFEQITLKESMWEPDGIEPSQSRMIINFRAGNLIVDNRNMMESSQCTIETPLGRVSVKKALWQMRIVFDPRSQIFDFTIVCSDGRVRFTDLQGEHYTLRAGQRLAGAGARGAPSIEVGEATDEYREDMQGFRDLQSLYLEAANEFSLYQSYLQPIKQVATSNSEIKPEIRNTTTKRPVVIEFASEPDPVTPFRGEVRPPSEYQADLF